MKKIFIFLMGIVTGAMIFGAGFTFAKDRYLKLQVFTKVLNLVQQYYVEPVDTDQLIYGGIKGMLGVLDPHTNYLLPKHFAEFENETAGEFGGLGIEITVQKEILTVISPIEDTPAWKAGIKAGDKIVTINGESTKGLSLVEAAELMRGKTGSSVRLGVYREGFDKPRDFSVTRAVVKIKSVKYTDLTEGYAYIRLTSFIENSADEMKKQIAQHIERNKGMRGLILDLRKNPGGLLDQAIKISDMFLEEGVIVSTIGRNAKEKDIVYAKKDGTFQNFPLVVLIDEYSASASEILAGALQDNSRGLVLGKRSFGKGSVQSVIKLGDGSGLKLTVARYYTPSGRSIQAKGIDPDVIVDEVDPEGFEKAVVKKDVQREKDMDHHLINEQDKKTIVKKEGIAKIPPVAEGWWLKDPQKSDAELTPAEKLLKRDFQVLQAYNYLKAWKLMKKFKNSEAI